MRFKKERKGSVLLEVSVACCITAILVAGLVVGVKTLRARAQCLVVGQHLREIHQAMQLYYKKHRAYPPSGSSLKVALSEFVADPALWADPSDKTYTDIMSANYINPDTLQVTGRILGAPCGDATFMALYSNGTLKSININAVCEQESQSQEDEQSEQTETQDQEQQQEEQGNQEEGEQVGDQGGEQGGQDQTGDQEQQEESEETIITVEEGTTTFNQRAIAYLRVIGSDFTYPDGTHVYLSATAYLNGEPRVVGDPALPGAGFEEEVEPGTRLTMMCEIKDSYTRWLWGLHGWPVVFRSDDRSGQCLTVVRGDEVPVYAPGYPCQQPVHEMLSPYVNDEGIVTIQSNEVLWLFDANYIGDDPWKIDYNDLVVIATAEATTETVVSGSNTDELGFTVALTNNTQNDDGTTSLTFTITSDSDNQTPALSHVSFSVPSSEFSLVRQTASNSRGYPMSIVDPDPTTGIRGLKVDECTLGENGAQESMTVSFRLTTGSTATITVATKAGTGTGRTTFIIGEVSEQSQPTNNPPTVRFTQDPITARVGRWLYIRNYIEASDPNGDELTYTFSGWKSTYFNRFSVVRPRWRDRGTHTVTVTVSDGQAEASASVTVRVTTW